MTVLSALDAAGRRRSPATMPGYHAGRPPRNKGLRYPADPPTIDEIVAVMRLTREDRHGWRLRAMIVVLWRAGLRIQEALALTEHDLDKRRGSILVRSGKGGRRREVGMDEWGWEQLRPWLRARGELPVGPLFCIIDGATRGRSAASSVASPRGRASGGGSRRTSCATRTRSSSPARACRSTSSSGSSATPTSRGRSLVGRSTSCQEIIAAVRTRRAPMMSASAGLKL
jgi:integrase